MNSKTIAPTPQLDLNSVIIDVRLAQRVPYTLSRYYLALPLSQDNGSVSVAMAYPENMKARQVLSRLLKAQVVPVFTPAEHLLPMLERLYCPENEAHHAILACYEQPEWETAVTMATSMLSNTFRVSATTCSNADLSLNEVQSMATNGQYELVVMPLPISAMLPVILNQATTPIFFVQAEQPTIRHILVVMRGFASDEQALDWLAPIAWQQQAKVTLLPLTNDSDLGLGQYLHRSSSGAQHLERCLRHLHVEGVIPQLKFRQGNPIQQVLEEFVSNINTYDLLAIAAEAEGDFVSQVITAVTQNQAHNGRPIFVFKPMNCSISQQNNLL